MSRFLLFTLCSCLVVGCLAQETIDETEHLTELSAQEEDTNTLDIRQLLRGEPLVGVVEKDESRLVHFGVLPLRGRFPDVVLFLEAVDPQSEVSVYCSARHHLRATVVPSKRTAQWKSTKQGQVFISAKSLEYQESIVDTQLPRSGIETKVARFSCAIHGVKSAVSKFQLTLRLSFTQRTLQNEQQDALREIFKECCPESDDCKNWRRQQTQETNLTDTVEFDFCHRTGSVCTESGELRRLDLNDYGLKCKLPKEALINLTTLESLDLSNNQIHADIGHDIVQLSSLKHLRDLSIASNLISGDLSVAGVCYKLLSHILTLDLDDNYITGRIPACLFSSSRKTEHIYLSGNKLSGSIPDVFSSSSHLKALALSRNQLIGEMPVTIGRLKFLEVLYLDNNNLNGAIPSSFSEMDNLQALDISGNRFSKLPSSWSTNWTPSKRLTVLRLQNNKFKGELPSRLVKATSLELLDLSNNGFAGELFAERHMFPHLRYFNLSYNELTGTIPEEFASLGAFGPIKSSEHQHLFDLRFNQLYGDLPDFMDQENSPDIVDTEIYLEGNNLTCHRWSKLNYIPNFECKTASAGNVNGPEDEDFLKSERDIRDQLNSIGSDTASLFRGEAPDSKNKRANAIVGVIGAFVATTLLVGIIVLIIKYKQRRERRLGLAYDIPEDFSTSSGSEGDERRQAVMNGTSGIAEPEENL